MLDITQLISFEISTECNLSERHKNICPIGKRKKISDKVLTDEIIIKSIFDAYNNGFTGFIAFHFYNEPMMNSLRMFSLMDNIRMEVPRCRFLLWTNGTILIQDPHLLMFERTYISNYFKLPFEILDKFFNNIMINDGGEEPMDSRLKNEKCELNYNSCGFAIHDFAINNSGDVHLCCYDWENEIKIGNIFDLNIVELSKKKWEIIKNLWWGMNDNSPKRCLTCINRHDLCKFEDNIYRKTLERNYERRSN
jgi:radical SAM protein with 4Fe4S-binding SPASM domain